MRSPCHDSRGTRDGIHLLAASLSRHPSLKASFIVFFSYSAIGASGGLTVRPLQPMLRDVFDPNAQGEQLRQCDLVGVRGWDAAERALQSVAGRVGPRDQLVGGRRRRRAGSAVVGRSTQCRHRGACDVGPTGQQLLHLVGVVVVQLAEFVQRARRRAAPRLQCVV